MLYRAPRTPGPETQSLKPVLQATPSNYSIIIHSLNMGMCTLTVLGVVSCLSALGGNSMPFWSESLSVVWSTEVVPISEVGNTLYLTVGASDCVRCTEVVRISKCSLLEVLL